MSNDFLTREGLELDAPQVGDIVTVTIKPPASFGPSGAAPRRQPRNAIEAALSAMRAVPEHENTCHYKINAFWEVRAVNGGQAVVWQLTNYWKSILDDGPQKPELWAIERHRWFEASGLYKAMQREHD